MKALAHVILHQLLFAVWLLAMWVLDYVSDQQERT